MVIWGLCAYRSAELKFSWEGTQRRRRTAQPQPLVGGNFVGTLRLYESVCSIGRFQRVRVQDLTRHNTGALRAPKSPHRGQFDIPRDSMLEDQENEKREERVGLLTWQ